MVIMKLVTWNVNGIRASYPKGLKIFVEEYQPDILCLQETKAHLNQVSAEIQSLGYPHWLWSMAQRKGYSGVATFSQRPPLKTSTGWGQQEYESEGRITISEYLSFDLYNIYFPNGGSGQVRHEFKQKFLQDLVVHLKPKLENQRPMIIVGDYNIAPTSKDLYDPVRLAKESGFLPEERQWFADFFALGFVDTFRYFYPDLDHAYSWWSYRELARVVNRGWRIDFICVTQNLIPYMKSARICSEVLGSDHCPVLLELDEKIF
jgi:exodeoxyribonuclease III